MIRWVDTVGFDKLHAVMLLALQRVEAIFKEAGQEDLWITSGNDSTHKVGSDHYDGRAFDFRTHTLPTTEKKQEVFAKVKAALGPKFFVDLEDLGTANEHLHVQYNGI